MHLPIGRSSLSVTNRRVTRAASAVAWRLRVLVPEYGKRALDICFAGFALIWSIPLFTAIALLIKLEDGGPILFWQQRVGRRGRIFQFPKFRSMVVNAEARLRELHKLNQHGQGVTFKMKDDPRITRVGRWIRRFSLDETPQLWCVLRGDMTLVGPRPALPKEVARYTLAERRRLEAVPGLTCIWQVSGRSNLDFPIQYRMDLDYIEQRSMTMDLKLLAATVPAVLTGRGAY